MLTSLTCGVTGMQSFQTSLDVIGNNISNSNTTGYKTSRANSPTRSAKQSALHRSPSWAPEPPSHRLKTDFTQGTVSTTGVSSDMAISGDGFSWSKIRAARNI